MVLALTPSLPLDHCSFGSYAVWCPYLTITSTAFYETLRYTPTHILIKNSNKPGVVAHVCNPTYSRGRIRQKVSETHPNQSATQEA
jgi:hypothetical protein